MHKQRITINDVPGYYGMFQGCSGVFQGVPGFTDTHTELISCVEFISVRICRRISKFNAAFESL